MRYRHSDYDDDAEPIERPTPDEYLPTPAEARAMRVPAVPANAQRDADGFVLSPNRDQSTGNPDDRPF